jgi:hypothetical protein
MTDPIDFQRISQPSTMQLYEEHRREAAAHREANGASQLPTALTAKIGQVTVLAVASAKSQLPPTPDASLRRRILLLGAISDLNSCSKVLARKQYYSITSSARASNVGGNRHP